MVLDAGILVDLVSAKSRLAVVLRAGGFRHGALLAAMRVFHLYIEVTLTFSRTSARSASVNPALVGVAEYKWSTTLGSLAPRQ